jgi:hypothetical protein
MENLKELCAVFLPKDTLTHFDITDVSVEDDEIHINITEKNNPPEHKEKLNARGFKTITVSDFPIRGKKAVLTYHRRYWQTEQTKKLITSDIPLVHTGTKLEQDFAEILKKSGGDNPDFLGEYRDFIPTPGKRI